MRTANSKGRLPLSTLAEHSQIYSETLVHVAIHIICYNIKQLSSLDDILETPLDIARRSGACPEIIELLSLTPESAGKLLFEDMIMLFAPDRFDWTKIMNWLADKDWQSFHSFLNEKSDEIGNVLLAHKFEGLTLFIHVIIDKDDANLELKLFLLLRIIKRFPECLNAVVKGMSMCDLSVKYGCREVHDLLRNLTVSYVESVRFSVLLKRLLPDKFREIFATYFEVVDFVHHVSRGKAVVGSEVKSGEMGTIKWCVMCHNGGTVCCECREIWYCCDAHRKANKSVHKKNCAGRQLDEREKRELRKGMVVLGSLTSARFGIGNGGVSLVLGFLKGVPN